MDGEINIHQMIELLIIVTAKSRFMARSMKLISPSAVGARSLDQLLKLR
jgi:hypothetical protein